MFQFGLTSSEKDTLLGLSKEVKGLLRKTFLPELDSEAPLFQLTNLNVALGSDIKGFSPDGAEFFIRAKELEIEYLDQQLRILEGEKVKESIQFSDWSITKGKKAEQAYIEILAWNWMLSFIDSNIQQVKILGGTKEETVEQTKERLARDSSK